MMLKIWHLFWIWYHETLSKLHRKDGSYQTQQFIHHRAQRKHHLDKIA